MRMRSLALFAYACATLIAPPTYAAEKLVTLGTAGVTGVYYPAGGAICRLVNRSRKDHNIRCEVESTGGSINNLESIRSHELDAGLVQSDWLYNALRGTEVFAGEKPNPNLRVLFALHAEPFTVITRKDAHITGFDQLKGKRVNIGSPGSGMRATMEELMKRQGWTRKSFAALTELKSTEQGKALCGGHVDALIFAGGHPNGFVHQITSQCDTRIVNVAGPAIDALLHDQPFYFRAYIPGNMYNGTPDVVKTFGVKAVAVTSTDMDEATAYQLVKAVFDNVDNFKTLHPVFAPLTPREMVRDAAAIGPLHPGAERYFREKGLLQ